jgi:hypothetical protein
MWEKPYDILINKYKIPLVGLFHIAGNCNMNYHYTSKILSPKDVEQSLGIGTVIAINE